MRHSHRILDPIHGFIGFNLDLEGDVLAWQLIDRPIFQRLRRIRQLGFAEFVFPGASHSRFLHSIGVFHMARELTDIAREQLGTDFDPRKALIAQSAALLHDIGHGPFSHAFESCEKTCGHDQSHEDWTLSIIEQDDDCSSLLNEFEIRDEVVAMIAPHEQRSADDEIYHAIISSQFDADRLDYLQRDRYMSGIGSGGFDTDWLLECLEISKARGFYLNQKSLYNAEEYLLARYHLYLHVYTHKTIRAAEIMLGDILLAIAKDPEASGLEKTHPLRRYYNGRGVRNYLALDDMVIWQSLLEISQKGGDENLRDLAASLYRRQFYKSFDVGRLAEREEDGEEKLKIFLHQLERSDIPHKRDEKEINLYIKEGSEERGIYIGSDDLLALSPMLRAIPPKKICRIYARDGRDIERAQHLWEEVKV